MPTFAPRSGLILWSIDLEIVLESFYSWVVCLLAIKWHLLSVIFYKSGLKAILMLTLFPWEFCQVYCEALHKYGLFTYFDSWFSDSVFLTYSQWKSIVKTEIREFEENTWKIFVIAHPSYKLAETCLHLVSPQVFWSISNQYPNLLLVSMYRLD